MCDDVSHAFNELIAAKLANCGFTVNLIASGGNNDNYINFGLRKLKDGGCIWMKLEIGDRFDLYFRGNGLQSGRTIVFVGFVNYAIDDPNSITKAIEQIKDIYNLSMDRIT